MRIDKRVMKKIKLPNYSKEEEKWNFITHGLATGAGLIGVIYLLKNGFQYKDTWLMTGLWLFGIALVGTLAISTIYHWGRKSRPQTQNALD